MDNVPVDSSPRSTIARRLLIQSSASGEIKLPVVPGMLDEYVTVCRMLFGSFGIQFTDDELAHLRGVLTEQRSRRRISVVARSQIVITKQAGVPGGGLPIAPRCLTVEGGLCRLGCYSRAAVVRNRARRAVDGAGGGEGAGAVPGPRHRCRHRAETAWLARRGHPVDAVEMTEAFARTIAQEAAREGLDVRGCGAISSPEPVIRRPAAV